MEEKSDLLSENTLSSAPEPELVVLKPETEPESMDTSTDPLLETLSAKDADNSTDILTETLESGMDNTSSTEAFNDASLTNEKTSAEASSSDASSVAAVLNSVDDLQYNDNSTTEASGMSRTSMDQDSLAAKSAESEIVCSLEEELKRLHEGDGETSVDVKEKEKPIPVAVAIKENSVESIEKVLEKNVDAEPEEIVPEKVQKESRKEADPLEVSAATETTKDPVLIKNAQAELKKTDILVCGGCHEVFHFVQEFQSHKSGKCSGKTALLSLCEGEYKSQIWGYNLWKTKQQKSGVENSNSWSVYQKWCKMSQADKDAWINAGQTLQFCARTATAKVSELRPKIQVKQLEKDPLALDVFESNKENSVVSNKETAHKASVSEVVKKTIIKPIKLGNDVSPAGKNVEPNTNKALRTVRSTEKREYVVERIVAKRFNPKRKSWEYQIKWENFPSDENTWEPINNLSHCKQMVQDFEEQLRKLKAEKAKQQAAGLTPKGRGRPVKSLQTVTVQSSPSSSSERTPGRPTRTSKQKALNQVKAWCGNISDADESGIKRPYEDDDSDDSFEKKMKYEDYSDESDTEVKPKPGILKKPISASASPKPTVQIIKNGVPKTGVLPQNVLIPDANGVVRIHQKQLPSLSTGVYIMSKTAGIIKLDSTTSKVATSGGQTIVKVAPKIGQTQIKIVKKDGPSTTTTKQIIQMAPNKGLTPTKMYRPMITKVKKAVEVSPRATPALKVVPRPIVVKEKQQVEEVKVPTPPQPIVEAAIAAAEESDDGLEELPFPEDIQVPEPDSPPREFVLDPFTGKIAGKEYPEHPVEEEPETDKGEDDTSLENIVKLAAADITEEDLKTDSGDADMPMETEQTISVREAVPQPKMVVTHAQVVSSATASSPIKVTLMPTLVRSEASILNKALSGVQVQRKSLVQSSPQSRTQHRVLTPSMRKSPLVSSVVKVTPSASLIRTRPVAPKPKFNIAGPSKVVEAQQRFVHSPRNVYARQTPGTRKIGNTTIRTAHQQQQQTVVQRQPQPRIMQPKQIVHRLSPRKEASVQKVVMPSKPKTVISMPSLLGDDDSTLTLNAAVEEPKLAPVQLPAAQTIPTPVEAPVAVSPPKAAAIAQILPEEELAAEATGDGSGTDISSFTLADQENPIFITGDDGTVYQVAGQNEQGQTILLTQGSDGQQQCLLVTNEVAEAMDTNVEEQQTDVSMTDASQESEEGSVTEPLSVKTDLDTTDQVVAQVVRAEPPSPGGTHKVVVMLPDGNLMVTQVSPEEYASLELD